MPIPSSSDLAAAQAALQTGSRSFHLASRLLPRRVRHPAAVLYAFCREADDLVDEGGGFAALTYLHERVGRLQVTDIARDQLLAQVMRQHEIPQDVLLGLLEGFAMDVAHRQPQNLDALVDYAVRVAGTVGVAMALVMGVRDRAALQAALALGVAMQFTNICRDVGEDASIGRLYLPRTWMIEAGIDPDQWRTTPEANAALKQVVARLLALADQFYVCADQGLGRLPADCRPGITAARRLYAGIGHRLRIEGCDAVSRRTVLGPLAKIACLVRPARVAATPVQLAWCVAALERSAGFLLQACPPPGLQSALRLPRRRQTNEGRTAVAPADRWIVGVIDLFERLELRAAEHRATARSGAAGDARLDWHT